MTREKPLRHWEDPALLYVVCRWFGGILRPHSFRFEVSLKRSAAITAVLLLYHCCVLSSTAFTKSM